jgi:hypothetical protein
MARGWSPPLADPASRRLLYTSGEEPLLEALLVEVEERGHPLGEADGVREAIREVEHVLQRVIGRVANVGLRIDDQPGLAPGSQDVLWVQVGTQQRGVLGVARQTPEQLDAGPGESRVQPELGSMPAYFASNSSAHRSHILANVRNGWPGGRSIPRRGINP